MFKGIRSLYLIHPVTAIILVVSTIFSCILVLLPRIQDLTPNTPMISLYNEPLPNERFIVAFGDSYSRSGFKMNYTYTKTGHGIHDMDKKERSDGKTFPGPSPQNPIGNPAFPGETSAGSGATNWIGYMATEFNTTLTMAYIFARSGSVVDGAVIPPRLRTRFSFAHQIGHFNDTIGHRPDYAAWTVKNIVATIWFGINDVAIAYSRDSMMAKIPAANQRVFNLAEHLYEIGIRQFIFIEVPPYAVVPGSQTTKAKDVNHKVEKHEYAISLWNRHLKQNIIDFREGHWDADVKYVELWDIFYEAFLHPKSLGAENSTCIDPKGKECLWSESSHPGRRIHQLIGARVAETAWGSTI